MEITELDYLISSHGSHRRKDIPHEHLPHFTPSSLIPENIYVCKNQKILTFGALKNPKSVYFFTCGYTPNDFRRFHVHGSMYMANRCSSSVTKTTVRTIDFLELNAISKSRFRVLSISGQRVHKRPAQLFAFPCVCIAWKYILRPHGIVSWNALDLGKLPFLVAKWTN